MKLSGIDVARLPSEREEKLQLFIDYFGQVIFALRQTVLESQTEMLKAGEAARRLGRVKAEPYEALAGCSEEQRMGAIRLCEHAIDLFGELVVSYLDHSGSDLHLDAGHIARFRLLMEVVDRATHRPECSMELSHDDQIALSQNWGRWRREFGNR